MFAPAMLPSGLKLIRMNLPNRDELLLRWVCALPNASRIGLACKIWRSRSPSRPLAFIIWDTLGAIEVERLCPPDEEDGMPC